MKSTITNLFKIIAVIAAILGGTLLVVFAVISVQDASSNFQKESELEAQKDEVQCLSDINCWAKKESVLALQLCMKNIERFAKYDSRWKSDRFSEVLSAYKWADKDKGIVRYLGGSLQLQNGFGAWQSYIYSCDFDPSEQMVVDVRAEPGRL